MMEVESLDDDDDDAFDGDLEVDEAELRAAEEEMERQAASWLEDEVAGLADEASAVAAVPVAERSG